MHIAVSWDIHGGGETWNLINSQLYAVLAPYHPYRPLNTLYVLSATEAQRTAIVTALQVAAKAAPVTTHVAVTPLMVGGVYDGYLPQDAWAELNARTST